MSMLLKGKVCTRSGVLLASNKRYAHGQYFRHQQQVQALLRFYLDIRGHSYSSCLETVTCSHFHTNTQQPRQCTYSRSKMNNPMRIIDALDRPLSSCLFSPINHQKYPQLCKGSARCLHLSTQLLDQPSSKVEITVQTIKNKQKEKVEEIMKEAAAAGAAVPPPNPLSPRSDAIPAKATKSAVHADTISEVNSGGSKTTASGPTVSGSATATQHLSGVEETEMSAATKKATATAATTASMPDSTTSASTQPTSEASAQKTAVIKKPLKTRIWEELVHYYHGFRLLTIDINICRKLLWRVLQGKTLTRRENRLLVRTTSDVFRLIPFSVFIIVPFMELLLPVFIKLFPGLLPSTFQTAKERQDKLKHAVQVRLEMVKFLQKTLDEMAVQHKEHKSEEAIQFADFFQRIKNPNEYVSTEEIIKFAKRFEDEITLDSLSREQLIALCRVLDVNTVGTTSFLRFQLRLKLRSLAADDRVIAREGVNSLDMWEVQQACKARGMRAYGLTEERMRNQLQEWIDLSLNEKVPQTLILLSRTMLLSDDAITSDKLKETIRVLPDSLATQTKAAISEREGKIDNKTQIEIIKEEERKIKEEREEEREKEKAEKLRETEVVDGAAPSEVKEVEVELTQPLAETKEEPAVSSKDMALLNQALKTLSKEKEMVVEKEAIKDLKEELEDYKEDVQELREVGRAVQEPVDESKAAKLLFNKVNRMIGQLDKVLEDMEQKQKQELSTKEDHVQNISEPPKSTGDDLVHIHELVQAINKIKHTKDEKRLGHIINVLSKIDSDNDGLITIDEVKKVVDVISRDNVHLNEKQLEELIQLLEKEQNLQAVGKIEKALAKSQKEVEEAKKVEVQESKPIIRSPGEATTCSTCLIDTAKIIEDHAKDVNKCDLQNTKTIDVDGKNEEQRGILEAVERQKEKILPSNASVAPPTISSTLSSAVPQASTGSNQRTTHTSPPKKASQVNSEDKMM